MANDLHANIEQQLRMAVSRADTLTNDPTRTLDDEASGGGVLYWVGIFLFGAAFGMITTPFI